MPPKSIVPWTLEEQLSLVCQILFKDGNVPSYKDVVLEGRTTKAIGNTLRDLKKKYTPENKTETASAETVQNASKAASKISMPGTKGKRSIPATASGSSNKRARNGDTKDSDNEDAKDGSEAEF